MFSDPMPKSSNTHCKLVVRGLLLVMKHTCTDDYDIRTYSKYVTKQLAGYDYYSTLKIYIFVPWHRAQSFHLM